MNFTIEDLTANYCQNLGSLSFIPKLSMLTRLSIVGMDVEDSDLAHIQNSMVTTLDISKCLYITPAGFQHLNKIVHLRMDSMEIYIHGSVFQHLQSVKSLTMERVTEVARFTEDDFNSLASVELLVIPSSFKALLKATSSVKVTWI
jgi:hypothetical protein